MHLEPTVAVEVARVNERLEAAGGGYEVVHTSPGLEVGVYVLVAPEPDRQQPHEEDELYLVLDGSGVLEIEGDSVCSSRVRRSSWQPAPTTASPPTSS